MNINTKNYIVKEKQSVNLKEWPTNIKPLYESKNECNKRLKENVEQLSSLQELHYATQSYPLLFILQGMDASGKDSLIRYVMSGLNPQGCQVSSFKEPSAIESSHDFLWRYINKLPERGKIEIFNRSYYEEVLIIRVHSEIFKKRNIPKELLTKSVWTGRYDSINNLEEHLSRNGTKIVKIFLHLSKDEQKKRLLDRIENPKKNWKITEADLNERNLWDEYMHFYEECISATSKENASWYIIPADDKKNASLIFSQIILETMGALTMEFPKLTVERAKELQLFKEVLSN